MDPQRHAQAIASLRAITYRISSTPTKQLPNIAPHIAGSLWACRALLSISPQTTKTSNEAVVLVNRFKTSLSSLLQDRAVEGRWAGVVLVKATIEAGGIEVLVKAGAWIRSLLAILKKPDPPTTRKLAVLTLIRLFVLTWDHANLVRDITTPNLPTFISICLSNVENRQKCSGSELETVLQAFTALLPRHPTIFRTFEGQIRSLLLRILSATSPNNESDMFYTHAHKSIAKSLFVSLHHCAPKQGAAEKWNETVISTVASAHTTCDLLFRSIIENWSSTTGFQRGVDISLLSAAELQFDGQDSLGLLSWRGIFAGSERLISLLDLLRRHLEIVTAASVVVPIGIIADLLTRILALTVPSSDTIESFKINSQIPKDEREAMASLLPSCHVAAFELANAMLVRFGHTVVSIVQALLELANTVFVQEKRYEDIRTVAYRLVRTILELSGRSMSREDVAELAPFVKACCDDLLPSDAERTTTAENQGNGMTSKPQLPNGSPMAANPISGYHTHVEGLQTEARSLLHILLSTVNPTHLARKVRVQMERTAVLSKNREALIACVMNPAKKERGTATQTSLLPLLARQYPGTNEVEAFLRPRMPVLMSKSDRVSEEFEASIADEGSVLNGTPDGNKDGFVMDDQSGNERTDDLFPRREEQTSGGRILKAHEDDLYAVTRRPPPLPEQPENAGMRKNDIGSTSQDSPATKRPANEPPAESVPAKRLRASPIAAELASDSARSFAADAASIHTTLPVTAAVEQAAANSGSPALLLHNAPLPQNQTAGTSAFMKDRGQINTLQDHDDDSDFEIPPLNMEPDTDPEEDGDDDDDGED